LAGVKLPEGLALDGISIVPALEGKPLSRPQPLYWELHEAASIQALRQGDWKLVRNGPDAKFELYNLNDDPSESKNLADAQPERTKELAELMSAARTDSPMWPMRKARVRPARKAAGP
jgi:arylsulfatase A-like enzyme